MASGMFVNCRKSSRITGDNGQTFDMPAGFIGEVPEWVAKHWYFQALCKDGTVTAIVSKKDKDLEEADLAADAKEAEAAKAAEFKAALDEAKAKAKEAAEAEAAEKGLDTASTRKLVTQMQKEAAEAVKAQFEA